MKNDFSCWKCCVGSTTGYRGVRRTGRKVLDRTGELTGPCDALHCPPRYFVVLPLRKFALAQLEFHGETTSLRQRHYLVYRQLFRTGDGYLRRPQSARWLVRLTLEQDNLRAALAWSFGKKQYADTAWLIMAIGYFWFLVGQRYEIANTLALLGCIAFLTE